jgi:hypothetical protein
MRRSLRSWRKTILLCDVNVLLYAYRDDAVGHREFKGWLDDLVGGASAYGVSDHVLSGFLRIVTNPRIHREPTPIADALEFATALRENPGCVRIAPGPRHWTIFDGLCRAPGVKGDLVPDAYLAALAIESGCELITTDGDFARFPGLRWRHPLAS